MPRLSGVGQIHRDLRVLDQAHGPGVLALGSDRGSYTAAHGHRLIL